MNDLDTTCSKPVQPERKQFSGSFWLSLIASVFGCFCLLSTCGGVVLIPFFVAFGWISFLGRVVPEMTVDWAGIGMAVLCLLLLVGVIQLLGRRVARPSDGATWPWTKSALLASALVVIFWAGLSAVGLTRAVPRFLELDEWASSRIREAGARTLSQNNLKQMALGLHNHHDEHKQFPLGGTFDADGRALHGWETSLLPYIEQGALYKQIRHDLPWRHPDNRAALATEVYEFRSPYVGTARSADGWALTHYAGNVHLLVGRPLKLSDIVDGTSNTLLLGETAAEFTPWGKPFNVRDPGLGINRTPGGFGCPDPTVQGANFAVGDGSVRFINENVSPRVLKALATPAGGEAIDDPNW
jgi:hypothetical protein